mgnify:CR=1 FL=1
MQQPEDSEQSPRVTKSLFARLIKWEIEALVVIGLVIGAVTAILYHPSASGYAPHESADFRLIERMRYLLAETAASLWWYGLSLIFIATAFYLLFRPKK